MKPVPAIAYPVHDLILKRWSPRAFSDKPVPLTVVQSLFEAARWSASCFNEQPWVFVYATHDNAGPFARMVGCLVDKNRVWASQAPVLIMTVAKMTFSRNGKPNPYAWHDVGLAMGNLTVQATAMGLSVHHMAGFDKDKARTEFAIPEGYEPVTMVAVGYTGDPDRLAPELAQMEKIPQSRNELTSFVYNGGWGSPIPV
jgi:nitroreductase